jgi:putative Mg2+ transporter-C (MgtC) family protein
VTLNDMLSRIGVAIACGAVLGWERESQDKPAGLRTHMMVGLGAAAFTIATLKLAEDIVSRGQGTADPVRMIDGIIGGIGFLGAGTIIQSRGAVQGITTASGIWLMGAVGVSAGCGYFDLAAVTTGCALAILWLLGRFQAEVLKKTDDS